MDSRIPRFTNEHTSEVVYQHYARNVYQARADKRSAQKGGTRIRPSSRSSRVLVIITLLILLCLFAVAFFANDAEFLNEESKSTPQGEWQQGVMPYLYQTDPEWANYPYAESFFGESGCGPISLTMVYIFLTGDQTISPTDVADRAEVSGYANADGTSWSFMSAGAASLGLKSEQTALDEPTVRDHLTSGRPIICIMGEGDFTTTGHFIVLCGITDEGLIELRDSNSVERSSVFWDLQTLQEQYRNAWVYWI